MPVFVTKQSMGCWLMALTLTACASTAPVSEFRSAGADPPPPPARFGQEPAVALPALVQSERQAAIEKNQMQLAQLWATEARIEDGRGTVEETDDYRWVGRQAILDRYQIAVFPNPPAAHSAVPDLQITVAGNHATAIDPMNGDEWEFIFEEGRWWLVVLRYGISSP